MSKFLIGGLSVIFLAACSTKAIEANGQPEAYADGPAIWTLQDKDTTLHLFGLAPVLKPDAAWQSDAVSAALSDASLVIFEADPSPEAQQSVQALIPSLGLYTDGATLSAAFGQAERDEINAVSMGLGAPLAALDQLKPWLASVQLGVLAVSQGGFDVAATPNAVIAAQAAEAGTPVRSFESASHVLELMAGFSAEEQKGMLLHTVRTLRDDPEQQAQLAEYWLAGDVEAIGETLHTSGGAWSSDVIYDAMLVERNRAWATEIGRLLETETGTVAIVVGYGHLAGPDSLITMLSDAGYLPTRQ